MFAIDWTRRVSSLTWATCQLLVMSVSVCQTPAFGQVKQAESVNAGQNVVMAGRTALPGLAGCQSFQNPLRQVLGGSSRCAHDYALRRLLLSLAPQAGHFAPSNPASLNGAWRFASGLSRLSGVTTGSLRQLANLSQASTSSGADPTCPSGGTCWVGPTSGVWNTAANWSNGVPTSSTNVFIDNGLPQASAVTLNVNGATSNLTIDSDDSLGIGNNLVLTVNGTTISNAGHLSMNSTGNATYLILGSSNVTLSGGGTLTLTDSSNPQNYVYGASGSDTLTNQETIQGSGNIGNGQMALINSGTINADNADHGLTIHTSNGVTNTGTLEATNGASLNACRATPTTTRAASSRRRAVAQCSSIVVPRSRVGR